MQGGDWGMTRREDLQNMDAIVIIIKITIFANNSLTLERCMSRISHHVVYPYFRWQACHLTCHSRENILMKTICINLLAPPLSLCEHARQLWIVQYCIAFIILSTDKIKFSVWFLSCSLSHNYLLNVSFQSRDVTQKQNKTSLSSNDIGKSDLNWFKHQKYRY